MDNFDAAGFSPEDMEAQLAEIQQVDEFNEHIDYEKFIVLEKKALSEFCRIVDPFTKFANDDYGKCVLIRSLSNDVVEISYVSDGYIVSAQLVNKSNKTIRPFAVLVATLKKLVTSAYASLIFVEQENDIHIALFESLLYLETKPLNTKLFEFEKKDTTSLIDKELAIYTFKKIGASLFLTDRPSERTIVVKDGNAHFNTGVFTSCSKSPFTGAEQFVLYKQVADAIAVLAELSKSSLKYAVYNDKMVVNCDDVFYIEVMIGNEEKVQEFFSPAAAQVLAFDAKISIINDNLLRLVSVVGALDYLSDIVTLSFTKEKMQIVIATSNQSKKSTYEFAIMDGKPEVEGEMKLTVAVLKMFLQIVGSDVKYSYNQNGLGIATENGKFLVRRS